MNSWKTIELQGQATPYIISESGKVYDTLKNKFIKPHLTGGKQGNRYQRVFLLKSPIRRVYVHRLVATAFLGQPTNLQTEVDHIDQNIYNNHKSNLRWVTRSQNCLNIATRKSRRLKFQPLEIAKIRALYAASTTMTLQKIANIMECSVTAIHSIVNYKTYTQPQYQIEYDITTEPRLF